MNTEKITVALVEDNAGLRTAIETMLKRAPDMACVGTFPDGEQAVRDLPGLRPRVVLMDINLPGMNGVQCVAQLAQQIPETQIIMLTVNDDTDMIFDSLSAGAVGYLLKPVRSDQLIDAIHEIIAGGAPMSSNIARRVVQTFKKPTQALPELTLLAPRERETLELLSKGLLQKEIAEQLGVSYWTVQTYIARIYEKLHVHSRAQAVAKYLGK
jgi:DNA-binding NarL/FixJ family response regulator